MSEICRRLLGHPTRVQREIARAATFCMAILDGGAAEANLTKKKKIPEQNQEHRKKKKKKIKRGVNNSGAYGGHNCEQEQQHQQQQRRRRIFSQEDIYCGVALATLLQSGTKSECALTFFCCFADSLLGRGALC